MRRRVVRFIPVVLIAVIAFISGAFGPGNNNPLLHAQEGSNETPSQTTSIMSQSMGNPYLIADIAETVTPAVVYIETEFPAPETNRRNPFMDPFFRDFFYPFFPWPEMGPQVSRGTGFIIDQEGHILTNQHVVGDMDAGQTITVKINTAEFTGDLEAELVGADYQLDLAILKIEKPEELSKLPTVPLGDSDASRVGEWVIAVGNPYGEQFEHTVTIGVLSAKGREIRLYDRERRQSKVYSNLMQTDAAINPGNSGGPLINIKGEVIGINTAVNAQAQGIGFAIPINTALEVKDELIETGGVAREDEEAGGPFLGVELQDVNEQLAEYLGLPEAKGALVVRIVRGSAAHRGGLQVYDVIQRFNDQEIEDSEDLVDAVQATKPGDEALIVVWREGRRIVVPVVLGERGQ